MGTLDRVKRLECLGIKTGSRTRIADSASAPLQYKYVASKHTHTCTTTMLLS
jgi:hypothetical protein